MIIWDGSTREMWETRPARRREEICTQLYIDQAPKVGMKFGMIVPTALMSSFTATYQQAASPVDFMQTVSDTFAAGQYPGDFQMGAIHVVAGRSVIYHLITSCCDGRITHKRPYSATGMVVLDVKQQWLSESFGQS